MTRRRGVGKAGIDRDEENTTLKLSSVRCTTLAADNLGIVVRLQHQLRSASNRCKPRDYATAPACERVDAMSVKLRATAKKYFCI